MESQRSQSSKSKQTTKRKAPVPESADILTSIACRRCRLKKIKCDPGLPSCHPCERNASECVVFDSTTGETHERRQVLGYIAAREREKLLLTTVSYLSAMQAKTNKLEALLSRRPLDAVTARPDQDQQRAPERMSRYVGDESGNRFMEHAITDMDQISTENSLPRPFRDCLEEARVTYVPPHPFPQYTQSLKLIEEYMRRFHPIHPILSQAYIWELHRRLYPDYQAPQQNDLNDDERFKLLMAFALGSVGSHSAGKQDEHPFGYFAAALESLLASGFAFSTLSELQNFLLIARFGTFHYIGCSIWELGQVCISMAIELGLHQHSDIDPSLGHEEQMRRRVFWDCYLLDRMSSSTLGRPFDIADSDIRMQLPTDVNRNGIEATAITEQENVATDLTMFRQTIRLMQIESAIRTSLLPQKSGSKLVLEPENHVATTDYGHLYEIFHVHSQALHDWWISRPPPSVTQGVYQAPEYLCFLYRRKKLDLARAILGQAWKSNIRSRALLRGCLGTALSLLSLFSIVHLKEAVTYTRGFVHLIFSTGMSIIHTCVELLRDSGAAASVNSCADIEAWWADGFQEISSCLSPHDVTDGLSLALDLLRSMSNYIPHTLQYTQAFEHLKAKFEAYLRSIGHDRILCAINSESRRPADTRLDENGSHDAQVRTSAGGQGIFDPAQDPSSHIGLQGVVVPQPEGASFPLRMEDASIPNRYDEGANDFWDVPFDLSDGAENNPWAYAPPMEQLTFDLLDYTWEAPILWQDYPVE